MYLWEGALWCKRCVRPLMKQLLNETDNDPTSSNPADWPQKHADGGTCEGCGAVEKAEPRPYTVIMVVPEFIAEQWGEEVHVVHVMADHPAQAKTAGRQHAWQERDTEDKGHADDWLVVAMFEGHLRDVQP